MAMEEDLWTHRQSIEPHWQNQERKMMMESDAIHFQHKEQNLQSIRIGSEYISLNFKQIVIRSPFNEIPSQILPILVGFVNRQDLHPIS